MKVGDLVRCTELFPPVSGSTLGVVTECDDDYDGFCRVLFTNGSTSLVMKCDTTILRSDCPNPGCHCGACEK